MPPTYVPAARILHWLIAGCVIGLVTAGLIMRFDLAPKPIDHVLSFLHIGFGITMLGLMALRLGIRLANPPPKLPVAIPAAQRAAARLNHVAFYLILFAMPVFGILFEQAHGKHVKWFGLVTLPTFIGKNDGAHTLFYALHFWVGLGLIALILLHALATWHHHRNGTPILRRMWK